MNFNENPFHKIQNKTGDTKQKCASFLLLSIKKIIKEIVNLL